MPWSIKVLVVDDSALMRRIITRLLESKPGFKVVDTAANGEEAILKARLLRPDVITMDVEMPGMDGVTAVTRLMQDCPIPVVMLSAHTTEGARVTMEALAAGAVDFVPKPTRPGDTERLTQELVRKIRVAKRAAIRRCPEVTKPTAPTPGRPTVRPQGLVSTPPTPTATAPPPTPVLPARPIPASPESTMAPTTPARIRTGQTELVVIGSSTGGPAALQALLPELPADFPCGVVVVQHIPEGFSGPMAEHLNRKCQMEVKHAQHGDRLTPGQVLVAPAGFDLTFNKYANQYSVALDRGSKPLPPGGFRPSVDVVMKSAAEIVGNRVVGVLLTGMGRDGAQGMLDIRGRGGRTIAQDESTSVVYGMPKAAAQIGAAEKILPLDKIAGELNRLV